MTRRLLFKYALGSTTGAGAGAAAGAGVALQELHDGAASQALQASQADAFLQLNSFANNPPCFLFPQPLSQASAHGSQAAISAPQLGPADPHGSQAACSQPQLGPAEPHGSQAACSQPQLGAAISQPQEGAAILRFNFFSKPNNGLRERILQPESQLGAPQGSQAAISLPQLGAADPQGSQAAISLPQLGAADPQGSQAAISQPQLGSAISAPQDGSHTDVSQHELDEPQPSPPSIRSNKPAPKLWLVRLAPRTIDPTIMFHFIDNHLPYDLNAEPESSESHPYRHSRSPVSAHEAAAESALQPARHI